MAALTGSCATALKEWATVLTAMDCGEQILLIRKGGLVEPGSGFEVVSPRFVFYPTFEHQAVNYLRAPYRRYFEEAQRERTPEGQVRVSLAGEAVWSSPSSDPMIVKQLAKFHIYNEEFVTQRLKWQPDQPLMLVGVRVFHLPQPLLLPVVPRYAGCKSWVDLESPVSLDEARPVLDDATFTQRLSDVRAIVDA